MEISQNTSSAQASNSGFGTAATSSVLSSDFEVFLQMLTAQAEYQDPLEPIDSSEYAAQLAQFSMVEQQVMTNDLMPRKCSPPLAPMTWPAQQTGLEWKRWCKGQ